MKIKTSIIGLGRIGAQYQDIHASEESKFLRRSHLSAILNDPVFNIVSLIDTNQDTLDKVKNIYPAINKDVFAREVSYESVGEAELVILCTPHEKRLKDIEKIVNFKPKNLLIEKPLAASLDEAIKIKNITVNNNVEACVNFNRRFEPSIQKFRYLVKEKPIKGIFRYSKGLLNYGSHMIDFIFDWFGEIDSVKVISSGMNDAISFNLRLKNGIEFICVAIDDVNFDQFEMELYFKDKKICFLNGFNEKWVSESIHDLYYPSYSHLSKSVELDKPEPVGNLATVYESIKNIILYGEENTGCSMDEAIYGMKVIDAVFDSLKKDKEIHLN